jgi:hypothetical protein
VYFYKAILHSSYLMNQIRSDLKGLSWPNEAQNAVERQNTNQLNPCISSHPSKPTKVSTSISRPIDYRIDPHVHARQSLPVRVVASTPTTAGAGAVVVSLICARTAGTITSSISVIISSYVIAETESAIVSIVRTLVRPALRGVEHAFAAGAGAGCCLEVLEAL